MHLFFDADWKEVSAEKAIYAIEIKWNKDGIVTKSTTYEISRKKKSAEEAARALAALDVMEGGPA